MNFTTHKIAGADAIQVLNDYRSKYLATGEYPFLIGDAEDLERVEESLEDSEQDPAAIIKSALSIQTAEWIEKREQEAREYEYSAEETFGSWPGEIFEKGSLSRHTDIVTGKIKPEVYLGLVKIDSSWQLPAVLLYGAWNDCPAPEVHCAVHRGWQYRYGSEIVGISGDVVECWVKQPPRTKEEAIALAWEQYWYCTDIVDQGCGSVANLAGTLLNSPYWFFWWD